MDDLVAAGVSAVAVSVVDPKTSTDAINRIASQVPLFTFDSDTTNSKRVAYIGSSNTELGKNAGELAVKAMPNGGKCMGFVGLPGADNARERIEGFKAAVAGHNIELVDVRGDDIDQTRARANVDDTLVANPENQLHGRLLLLQSAAHLRGPEGRRQARADHRHRLRRGSDHTGRRRGRPFAGTVVQRPPSNGATRA